MVTRARRRKLNRSELGYAYTKVVLTFRSLSLDLAEDVVPTNAVDWRRCSRSEQRWFRSYGRGFDRRRFSLPFAFAQEASASQEQKRAPHAGETAQKASSKSRAESRIHSQSDQVVDVEQRPHLLR